MIRFGAFADLQYADIESQNNRDYRASIEKFLVAAGTFHKRGMKQVWQFGDPINGGWDNLTKTVELFEKSKLPIVSILGNHDFLVEDDKKKDVPRMLHIPRKGYFSTVLNDPDTPENRWRVIVMHGGEISLFAADNAEAKKKAQECREKYRLPSGELPKPWNGSVTKTQLNWLEKELTKATERKESALVCSHFPLYALAGSIAASVDLPAFLDKTSVYFAQTGLSTWNGQEILKVLDRFDCVKAYFAGHLHEGGYGRRNKVHHVTFRGMVEWKENAYSIVTLEKNRIVIEGFGVEPSRELAID